MIVEGIQHDYCSTGYYIIESETRSEELKAIDTHMLLFEGVFLFRPELYQYWDF